MKNLEKILKDVSDGKVSVEDALDRLKFFPCEEIDDILFDHQRYLRKGFPEVIYGRGKTADQLKKVAGTLLKRPGAILITRVNEAKALELLRDIPQLKHDPVAGALYSPVDRGEKTGPPDREKVLLVTAGTSDLPVAREAGLTLELMDIAHKELIDVGVAGIHRLLSRLRLMESARVIICIAGMEGALPSIVAGLVRCPVIAVPTSTGYGSNMKGMVPLLAMLNSCAPGIGVVNIDNGFGAAALAASIVWSAEAAKRHSSR